jgi:sterol desaturase/sphingolipid hydroxylase (fatty acid hydroxylase superfamily)
MEYLVHSNIRVPNWIGYITQTPQMQSMHHQYGEHKSFYCDIVWFDMLFGTYHDPTRTKNL